MTISPNQFGRSIRAISDGLPHRRNAVPGLLIALVSCLISLWGVAFHPQLMHWFVLPVTLCGILIGSDAARWITGEADLFDPPALIGLLGYHFFFIAPLLMVGMNWRMRFLPDQPVDYRDWIGGMACLNAAGIVVYRAVRQRLGALLRSYLPASRPSGLWQLQVGRFWLILALAIAASVACQIFIFVSFGGIRGYIDSYTASLSGNDLFKGSSALFAVAESLPILCAIGLAVWARKRKTRLPAILCWIAVLGVLDLFIGGLRGSRSNVIWCLFWIAGIMHFYVRRLPRAVAYGGIVALYLFVSLYAAYKQQGSGAVDAVVSSGDYTSVSDSSEGPATVLVGDFSRTDVQSYLFYKQWNNDALQPALGATYLGALCMIVPRTVWPGRPPTILKWTTDAEYGTGAYSAGATLSSRVYGIAGEGMLNFGFLGVPLAYAVFGILVAALEASIGRMGAEDSRLLLLPFLINSLFVLLLNDSDNTCFYLFKYGLMPVMVVLLTSKPIRQTAASVRFGSIPFLGRHEAFR